MGLLFVIIILLLQEVKVMAVNNYQRPILATAINYNQHMD